MYRLLVFNPRFMMKLLLKQNKQTTLTLQSLLTVKKQNVPVFDKDTQKHINLDRISFVFVSCCVKLQVKM